MFHRSPNQPQRFLVVCPQQIEDKGRCWTTPCQCEDKNSAKFTDVEKANILQDQFSPSLPMNLKVSYHHLARQLFASIFDILITEDMVYNEIIKLSLNKSCGPDELHPRLLLELVDELSKPIASLLNNTTRLGVIPREWRRSNVSPIYKQYD